MHIIPGRHHGVGNNGVQTLGFSEQRNRGIGTKRQKTNDHEKGNMDSWAFKERDPGGIHLIKGDISLPMMINSNII
jgi:hypothetical protein